MPRTARRIIIYGLRFRWFLKGAAVCSVLGLCLGRPTVALAQTPPNTPIITTPAFDGQVVSPFDVHMETAVFSDPDPGDTHFCSDWEIWGVSPSELVWSATCLTGVEKVHTHFGDGTFQGSRAGQTSLAFSTDYYLRVRHRDQTGLYSNWAQRFFSTGAPTQVFPLQLDDVTTAPTPTWRDETSSSIVLLPGSPAPSLRLDSGAGELLLQISGFDGATNTITNPGMLGSDVAARVVIDGGSGGVVIPASRLAFQDRLGFSRTIYLPPISVPASGQVYFWISANGSTYVGNASQTSPDFSTLARGSPVPWEVLQPGFEVEIVATGFQLPVNIAFVPNPGPNPTDPLYYVSELYGKIKVVARNGTISDYATGLLNFDPGGQFPGSGEQGLGGIAVDPVSGDLFCGMLYDSAPPNGSHFPKVDRFHSLDGGRTASTRTTILAMVGEYMGASHYISNLSFGPDGKLYVHMGDGLTTSTALDLDSFRGKVLRMNLDGSAPSDNPLYNAGDGINARDYIYAYGFRNPFGGTWRAADNSHYEVENGPSVNDRFAKVTRGTSYGWDGSDASMTTNAIYNWAQIVAPVNIAWIQPSTFGGSGFPASMQDHAFVTESGPTYATGTNPQKRVVEFVVGAGGNYVSGPTALIHYTGTGQATAVGLAAGPDGLYLTDLYKDLGASTPIDAGASVLRIKYRGLVNFSASPTSGPPPLAVQFTDLSAVPGASAWLWDFGDGTTSTAQNPSHSYAAGVYDVRLSVTGTNGMVVTEKPNYITAGAASFVPGLTGNYYDNQDFTALTMTRVDSNVDFNWGLGAPSPLMGNDTFSVRWTGQVSPLYSETYRFYSNTDDGARLWVNGQLLVDRWVDQALREDSGTITLVAGQYYDIQYDYYDNSQDAEAHLSWSSPSQPKQIIPVDRLHTVNTGAADFSGSPTSGPAPLSVQFTDLSSVPGASAWLWNFGDGTTDTNQNPTHLYAAAGVYDVRLDVTGSNGVVTAQKPTYITVTTSTVTYQPGLTGSYFDNLGFTGFKFSRVDSTIDFNWAFGSPSPQIGNDTYSVHWTGQVSPLYTETYRFYARSDDGNRLWINNQLIIDRWVNQALREDSGTVALVGGQYYNLQMDFFDNTQEGEVHLSWSSPSQAKQIIPGNRFRTNDSITAVEGPPLVPVSRVQLLGGRPNPFRSASVLEFALPARGHATLRVFDVRGAVVATLFDGVAEGQRRYQFTFDARALPAGVYFQQLKASGTNVSKKLVLFR